MKRLFITALLVCSTCLAQTTGDSKPATTNVPGAAYPRVHSDLRVTFQLKAPDARAARCDAPNGSVGTRSARTPYSRATDNKTGKTTGWSCMLL